jgi:hypothetical protein
MATTSWSSPHGYPLANAGFRTMGAEVNAKLASVGLVQTADTGQINWATIAPAPTLGMQSVGYEIWRFNDALQATAPIYIKLEYGTYGYSGSAAYNDTVGMWITVGTGTDGAGNITGIKITRRPSWQTNNAGGPPAAGDWPSYICHFAGYLGVWLKHGSGSAMGFAIARLNDAAGAFTADGYAAWAGGSSNQPASLGSYFASPELLSSPAAGTSVFVPGQRLDAVEGVQQVWPYFALTPAPIPLIGACAINQAGLPAMTTFTAAVVGATARTYMSLGTAAAFATQDNIGGLAMLWE